MNKGLNLSLLVDGMRVLLLLVAVFVCSPAQAADNVVLAKGQQYVSSSYQVQNFQDWLNLRQNQEKLPLTLVVTNGTHEAPAFKWFRLNVGGYLVATEKSLAGQEQAAINVSGVIPGGNSQVMIEAAGVPGSLLTWALLTPRITLTGVSPASAKPGDTITLTGSNFSSDANQNIVLLNERPARVLQASPTSLQVVVPQGASQGINKVQVNVDNNFSRMAEMTIAGGGGPVPELLSIDCWMAPPGGQIVITGRNFSADTGSNKVFFSTVEAPVLAASDSQLTVQVPNWGYGPQQLNIPITVTVNGIRSGNSLPFDIGPSYHGAIPQFTPD